MIIVIIALYGVLSKQNGIAMASLLMLGFLYLFGARLVGQILPV